MPIRDIRQMGPGPELHADVCIVGSGPAGLTVAAELFGSSVRVCVVESGGQTVDRALEDLDAIECIGLRRAPQNLVRSRLLGGTSHLWSGRCGLFDAIDYMERPWLPLSGWPIDHESIAAYVDRASRILKIGPDLHTARADRLWQASLDRQGWDASKLLPVVWQFSKHDLEDNLPARDFVKKGPAEAENIGVLQHGGAVRPVNFAEAHIAELQRNQNIDVVLNATATSIETNAAGTRVQAVVVRSLEGIERRVLAETVVLACGGIENARLLLASSVASSGGVGNATDQVGRYLADHALVPIGTYQGEGCRALRYRLGNRWLDHRRQKFVYNVGLRLSPSVQLQEQLLNCSLHLYEFGAQPNSVSSAAKALRQLKHGRLDGELLGNARAAVGHPMELLHGAYLRYAHHRPALGRASEVGLGCIVEPQLDADSRITLSSQRDPLGMPRARIDWRCAELEHRTAQRMAELVYADMTRLGMALPKRETWLDEGLAAFRARMHDGAHPMCSTRMASDPRKGVVDANCAVHGIAGLYIAGSSVFATPSHMNPTMMIVALSLRLADHLKSRIAARTAIASAGPTEKPIVRGKHASGRPARVGLIGAGHRVLSHYLPVLRSLSADFQVVGVTSRSQESAERVAGEIACGVFRDAASLVSEAKADFLIAAVSPAAIDGFLPGLTGIPVPLLLETPFAWNVRRGRKTLQAFQKCGMIVGVAEQFPYLPAEQLKRKVIELGILGRIVGVHNDHAVFDYHGIATLRSYLAWNQKPTGISATVARVPRSDPPASGLGSEPDIWMHGAIALSDGTNLVHHYSSDYFDSPIRGPRALRVYGTTGYIVGDTITLQGPDGSPSTSSFNREVGDGCLQSISIDTPSGAVRWSNPFADHRFSDEQIGIAMHLMQMRNVVFSGGEPIYSAERALEDSEILTAMSFSAGMQGKPVRWPLNANAERIKSQARAMTRKLRRHW